MARGLRSGSRRSEGARCSGQACGLHSSRGPLSSVSGGALTGGRRWEIPEKCSPSEAVTKQAHGMLWLPSPSSLIEGETCVDRRGVLHKHTCSSGLAHSACGFNTRLAFLVPAVLPGFELRHDRVFCAHDLEGLDRPHWQREPHRGGAEVGSTDCALLPGPRSGAALQASRPDNPDSVL